MMNFPGLYRKVCGRLGCALGSVILLLLALLLRQPLEASMATHMLLQMPAILMAGWLAARAMTNPARRAETAPAARVIAWLRRYDEQSVPGLLALVLLLTYWMIPKSLDHVLVSPLAESVKFVSLFIGGLILADCLARANMMIQLFFLGNIAWMMAVVGLLYQDGSTRLCNFYLVDDQLVAGQGLVTLSVVLPALWLWRTLRSRSVGARFL